MVIIALHLLCTLVIYPEPTARRDIRRKVYGLTAGVRPQIVLMGDSRVECGMSPATFAHELGMQPGDIINIAAPACDPVAAITAFRGYRERFSKDCILVLGVSVFGVNDGADTSIIGDETLWSAGLLNRLRLVGVKRALTATFLPERELVRRNLIEPLLLHWDFSEAIAAQGHRRKANCRADDRQRLDATVQYLRNMWFGDTKIDGIRWSLLRQGLESLRDAGVQVVVTCPPDDPDLTQAMAGTAMDAATSQFHSNLKSLCDELGFPFLIYTADVAAVDEPRRLFADFIHLNTTGAEWLTQRCASDLQKLLVDGNLNLAGWKGPVPASTLALDTHN